MTVPELTPAGSRDVVAQMRAAVDEWNPLAIPEIVERVLKTSGGRATIRLRAWTGRERLAYEDASTTRFLTTDVAGDATVLMGTMQLFAASLTLKGSTGFPATLDGRVFLAGEPKQVEADLLSISDGGVLAEIRRVVLEVQPLPRVDAGDETDDEDEEDGPDGGDPFPTPSTPPTATDGGEESESPEESKTPPEPTPTADQ